MMRPEAGNCHDLVGCSPAIEAVRRMIAKAARNRLPVLLLGESGTGKDIVARMIHARRARSRSRRSRKSASAATASAGWVANAAFTEA